MEITNQKEYLKKYLSIGNKDGKKKKRKKKVTTTDRIKIIDDDIDISKLTSAEDAADLFGTNEDAPQIVGVIDERPMHLRIDDYRKSDLWKPLGAEDNTPDDKSSKQDGHDVDSGLPWKKLNINVPTMRYQINDTNSSRKNIRHETNPSRKNRKETKSRWDQHDKNNGKRNEDMSPTRKNEKEKSYSPLQKYSDNSPPRRSPVCHSISNISLQRHSRSRSRNRSCKSDVDSSPPRRSTKESDNSPPRRHRKESITNSPQHKNDNGKNAVSSPLGRSRRDSQTSMFRRKDDDSSPPQRSRGISDSSPPRRSRKNSDSSPPRKKDTGKFDDRSSARRNRRNSDNSPPRKQNRLNDNSPPRRNRQNSDNSPPRKSVQKSCSPARASSSKQTEEPKRKLLPGDKKGKYLIPAKRGDSGVQKMTKTLDGKMAGLQNAQELVKENEAFRIRENEMFKSMSSDVSGVNAAPIIRDRKTGKIRDLQKEAEERREKEKKEEENKAKYSRWGRGLKQMEDYENRLAQDLHEMNKPLARYADDEDLEKYLKEQEREGDPMLDYIRKKKKKTAIESGKPVKPQYEGEFMPNRFGIMPGHRWDGVDRSNGYEKKWFQVQNSKRAQQEEVYKWSTEDM